MIDEDALKEQENWYREVYRETCGVSSFMTGSHDAKGEGKETNPKDVIGSGKLPLGLTPDTMEVFATMAFLEGALKYGRYNWRAAGVRASIYYDAVKRHLAKWWNGEWSDEKTGVPHLASALACIAIILDAYVCEKLTDDRPPRCEKFSALVDGMAKHVAQLKELFKDHYPKQWTIADTPQKWPFDMGEEKNG